jgi:hypothetical protein
MGLWSGCDFWSTYLPHPCDLPDSGKVTLGKSQSHGVISGARAGPRRQVFLLQGTAPARTPCTLGLFGFLTPNVGGAGREV